MNDEDFTEEEARDKLTELGFEVVDVKDQAFIGYSIEPNHNGKFNVCELYRPRGTYNRVAMTLSPELDDMGECSRWLTAYLDNKPYVVLPDHTVAPISS